MNIWRDVECRVSKIFEAPFSPYRCGCNWHIPLGDGIKVALRVWGENSQGGGPRITTVRTRAAKLVFFALRLTDFRRLVHRILATILAGERVEQEIVDICEQSLRAIEAIVSCSSVPAPTPHTPNPRILVP